MTSAMLNAIRQQPAALAELADRQYPTAGELLVSARRVVLVGTGTSHHAAELGAALLETADRAATAVSAQRFVRLRPPLRPHDVMIVITHTGQTAYALRCLRLAHEQDVPVIAITGQGAGLKGAIETVPMETSETYTISYLATLAVLVRLAAAAGVPDTGRAHLLAAADAVRTACDDSTGIEILTAPRSVAVVGSGLCEVTAREAALKLREASRQIAVGYDAELFLHGSAVPYGPDDSLVLIGGDGDGDDGFLDAVGRAARSAQIPTHRMPSRSLGAHPVLDQFALTARLQLLAARTALHQGHDPDTVITGGWSADDLWDIGRPDD